MTDSPAKRKSLAKFRKSLDVAERDARACRRYYAERMTYREIAAELGYTNESGAKRSADRGLKAIQTRGNENPDRRGRDPDRENREFVKGIRDNPPQKVSPTGAPVFGRDGEPVYDSQVSVTAASELRKLDQQTIDLLGLAAPRRSITATINAGIDARLAENERLLQARLVELQAENERLRRQLPAADVVDAEVIEEAG